MLKPRTRHFKCLIKCLAFKKTPSWHRLECRTHWITFMFRKAESTMLMLALSNSTFQSIKILTRSILSYTKILMMHCNSNRSRTQVLKSKLRGRMMKLSNLAKAVHTNVILNAQIVQEVHSSVVRWALHLFALIYRKRKNLMAET